MFSDCPMESLLSVSGTAVGGLQREEELGRPSSPGFRFPSPLLIRLMPSHNQTNAFSVCSHIRISCKMSFGGGKIKCSASKKRIQNHISICFFLGLVNIGIKHGPKSSFMFANRILGRTRNIWKCFAKTLVKPWMLSV